MYSVYKHKTTAEYYLTETNGEGKMIRCLGPVSEKEVFTDYSRWQLLSDNALVDVEWLQKEYDNDRLRVILKVILDDKDDKLLKIKNGNVQINNLEKNKQEAKKIFNEFKLLNLFLFDDVNNDRIKGILLKFNITDSLSIELINMLLIYIQNLELRIDDLIESEHDPILLGCAEEHFFI